MKLIVQDQVHFNEHETTIIEGLGYSIEYYANKETEGDVFVGMLIPPFLELTHIKNLKYIQSTIAGFDTLDMEAIKDRNIIYCNASGMGSIPIAEYAIHQILDFYKRAPVYRSYQKESIWGSRREADETIEELTDKKVLILGTGHIGQDIAKRLQAFDSYVMGVNTRGQKVDYFDKTVAMENLSSLLAKADVVIGALPLNQATNEIYNETFFKAMKKGALFMNVGRGQQVVLHDLIDALSSHIAHAILDVLPQEPLDRESELWNHPQITITPHISSSSTRVSSRTKEFIIEKLRRYAENERLENRII